VVTIDQRWVETRRSGSAKSPADDAELIEVVAQARAGANAAWETLIE
jgi:hypothetical protein